MSASPKDYEVGYKRPPKETRWKKGQSGNSARRRATRKASALESIEKLLLRSFEIAEKGGMRTVTALEVIVLQLWQKELAGNRRALSVRLKYEAIARENAGRGVEVELAESDYTRALVAELPPEGADNE